MERERLSKKRKKVLAAVVVLALVIVIGGTFAWFTSKDEVTNKLSAESQYGVAITESFTSPESWIPGQEVEKKVSAVNTGNVDAFLKLAVSSTLDLTVVTGAEDFDENNTADYVVLNTEDPDEVTSLQAGGILAYTSCENVSASQLGTVGTDFDASDYGAGYYVFARDLEVAADGTHTYEYVGYYYDGTNYYAVAEIESQAAGSSSIIDADGIFISAPSITVQKKSTNSYIPELVYDKENNRIIATYDAGTADTSDDIVIYINLATDATTDWTVDDENLVFYYNEILAAGATANELIASVELADTVSENAYSSFDFNLKIALDSIQVSSGDDVAKAVNSAGWDYKATVNGTSVEWNAN